jgi:uncharacterized protein
MLVFMPLIEDQIDARYSIQAYDRESVTINERRHVGSLVLSADEMITNWPASRVEDLDARMLEPVFGMMPEVVLLGTGERQQFPPPGVRRLFAERQLGLEVMDTGALCRTFNILVAEGRRVVAMILQT